MSFLRFAPGSTAVVRERLGYVEPCDAVLDPRGTTVRSTPRRRTVRQDLGDGTIVFRKVRDGRPGDAANEWRMLAELPKLGFTVPQPLFFARHGRRTAVGMLAVGGSPLDRLIAKTGPAGPSHDQREFLVTEVARLVKRVHDNGLCYRDLYWNHLFASGLDAGPVRLIDVERAFRPRFRRRRWIVKDLAGLVSSWPAGCAVRDGFWERFVLEYDAALVARDPRLLADVFAKARRIRAHVPRYGRSPAEEPPTEEPNVSSS